MLYQQLTKVGAGGGKEMVKPVSVAADVWKLMNVRRDRVPLGGLAEHKFPLSDFRFYFSRRSAVNFIRVGCP